MSELFSGVHHVALVTGDFDQLFAFYTQSLGLPEVGRFPGYKIAFLQAGATVIELVGRDAPAEPRGQGWNHLALEVHDLAATVATLEARGVHFHVAPKAFPPDAPQAHIAFFRDPDGNLLELYQPLGPRFPQANPG